MILSKRFYYFAPVFNGICPLSMLAAVAQLVEHQLPKLRVTSSNLACRSIENQALRKYSKCLFYIYLAYKSEISYIWGH